MQEDTAWREKTSRTWQLEAPHADTVSWCLLSEQSSCNTMDALDPAVCADTYFLIVMARMMLSESSAKASVAFLSQKIHVQMLFVCQTQHRLVTVQARSRADRQCLSNYTAPCEHAPSAYHVGPGKIRIDQDAAFEILDAQ